MDFTTALVGSAVLTLASIAVAASGRGFGAMQRKREGEWVAAHQRPPVTIAEVALDTSIKIEGTVVADGTVASPLTGNTGVLCVVQAQIDIADGVESLEVLRVASPFSIDDGSGVQAGVESDRAELVAEVDVIVDPLTSTQRSTVDPRLGPKARHPYLCHERLLRPGQRLFAFGRLIERDGGRVLVGETGGPTLVTQTLDQLRVQSRAEQRLAVILERVGKIGVGVGIGWAILGLVRWLVR